MGRRLAVAAAALLVALLSVPGASTVTPARADPPPFWPPPVLSQERLVDTAVRIDSRGGGAFDIGTGVGVGSHVVLTNAHLTRDPVTLVTRCDDDLLSVRRIERATDVDLAVVVTDQPGVVPIELAPQDPVAGEHVTMIGYPGGDRTVSGATVEGTLVRRDGTVLRFRPQPQPGQSGSPLVDDSGRLVGIAYAMDTTGGQGLAVPVSQVRAALDRWRASGVPIAATTGDPVAVAARSPIC